MSVCDEFDARTAWKNEPLHGRFMTHPELYRKVHSDGQYARFPGSTSVFRLNRADTEYIASIQGKLFRALGETGMLAAPLPVSTFHMTLHDFICPEHTGSPVYEEESDRLTAAFLSEVTDSAGQAQAIIERLRQEDAGQTYCLASDAVVNMVSKSLVLLLKPDEGHESDFLRLQQMHESLNAVTPLPYPLLPHITLAYFRPCELDGDRLGEAIRNAFGKWDHRHLFHLRPEALTVQYFDSMERYQDARERLCFLCDGGLNRSVMAAMMLNAEAQRRHLPLTASARAAYSGTNGEKVPDALWNVLAAHDAMPGEILQTAREFSAEDVPAFGRFILMTTGAMNRALMEGIPEDRCMFSRLFYGIPDPQYGEISYEQLYTVLKDKINLLLGEWEAERIFHP